MKTGYYWLFLNLIILWGCQKETGNPTIDLVGSTDCKSMFKSDDGDSSDQDCIKYFYSDNVLTIKHLNAGFNCCPEEFLVDLQVSGDTLIIIEKEKSALCDCDCLFDLDFTLTDVDNRTWWIRVKEPYIHPPDQKEILFEVNLKKNPQGTWCVHRTGYPWGG